MTSVMRKRWRHAQFLLKHAFPKFKCYFCELDLMPDFDCKHLTKVTVHHVDHNHKNDDPSNTVYSHRTCHRSYHLKVNHLLKKGLDMISSIGTAKREVRDQYGS